MTVMRVLVTGSEGFLGRHLVRALAARGYEAVHYDVQLGHDILDRERLQRALRDVSVCIHMAAVADLYVADEEPGRAREVNVAGTAAVLRACDAAGVRLLYGSTCCVYGNNAVERSCEGAPVCPTELYAQTKLEGERLVLTSPSPHAILRLATFYGPGMRPSLATWRFLHAAMVGAPIEIHGTGEQTRCYTHVDDVCTGIIRVLEEPRVTGIINIADERSVSVNELAAISMQVAGRVVPTNKVEDRAGQILHSAIDSSKLRELGWAPAWTLEDGLRDCLEEMRRGGADD